MTEDYSGAWEQIYGGGGSSQAATYVPPAQPSIYDAVFNPSNPVYQANPPIQQSYVPQQTQFVQPAPAYQSYLPTAQAAAPSVAMPSFASPFSPAAALSSELPSLIQPAAQKTQAQAQAAPTALENTVGSPANVAAPVFVLDPKATAAPTVVVPEFSAAGVSPLPGASVPLGSAAVSVGAQPAFETSYEVGKNEDGSPISMTAKELQGAFDVRGSTEDSKRTLDEIRAEIDDLSARKAELKTGKYADSEDGQRKREIDLNELKIVDGQLQELSLSESSRSAYDEGMEQGLKANPSIMARLKSEGKTASIANVRDAAVAQAEEKFAPLLASDDYALRTAAATAVEDIRRGFTTAKQAPSQVGDGFKAISAADGALLASLQTYAADNYSVGKRGSGSGGDYTDRDLENIKNFRSSAADVIAAVPGAAALFEAKEKAADTEISVRNGSATAAVEKQYESIKAAKAPMAGWYKQAEAEALLDQMSLTAVSAYKTKVDGILASGKTQAQIKIELANAATDLDAQLKSTVAQIQNMPVKTGNPFMKATYGSRDWDWAAVMQAGGLALALYSPIERRQSERRAERRADKQWEKEKDWWKERAEIEQGYRLEQIDAMAAAEEASSGGSVAAVRPANF